MSEMHSVGCTSCMWYLQLCGVQRDVLGDVRQLLRTTPHDCPSTHALGWTVGSGITAFFNGYCQSKIKTNR